MTNRRGFIIGLSAALAAPAIVRASSLMRVVVPSFSIDLSGSNRMLTIATLDDTFRAMMEQGHTGHVPLWDWRLRNGRGNRAGPARPC